MVEMTQGYSMFLDDAVKFFVSYPDMVTYTNSDAYYIAVRHFGEIDSVVVYEWFDVLENYSARVELEIEENKNNKKGIIK